MSEGGHSESLLLLAPFYQSAPSLFMLKSYGWGGSGWVAHVILVSALGQNSSIFLFWRTFIQLGDPLGLGLGPGLGPGLDNFV